MVIGCPVCRRQVHASENTGRVRRHEDTAGRTCPMSGRGLPLENAGDIWNAHQLSLR